MVVKIVERLESKRFVDSLSKVNHQRSLDRRRHSLQPLINHPLRRRFIIGPFPRTGVLVEGQSPFANPFIGVDLMKAYREYMSSIYEGRSLRVNLDASDTHEGIWINGQWYDAGLWRDGERLVGTQDDVEKMRRSMKKLRGKYLYCHCYLTDMCHADILASIVNPDFYG